jgi:hypothetical protein
VLGENILDHYTAILAEISSRGFGAFWADEFRPYLRGAAEQFAPEKRTLTEKLLRLRPRMYRRGRAKPPGPSTEN